MKHRLEKIRDLIRNQGLDAVVLIHLPNIRYLCGFSGSEGTLVVDGGGSCFLTDSRYTAQARKEVFADQVRQYKAWPEGVVSRLMERGCRKVGFEADQMVYSQLEKLREKTRESVEWMPLAKEITALRGFKDPGEMEVIRAAARLNAAAFSEIERLIRGGISERQLALDLEFALKRLGGDEKAFDFIVASGLRGALPHGLASEKKLDAGEMVTIDFGVRLGGYHSDETVTVALGKPPQRLVEVYDVVLKAHDLAIAALRPGVPLKEVDAAARSFIQERGFGEYFGHGLGHGVGLELHEYPVLSVRSEDIAQEGMVVTIEPGVYLPQQGGVRIEDMVLVTPQGCEVLTEIPKKYRMFSA